MSTGASDMDEYSPMDEIGLSEDRQFICNCHGLIAMNDSTRNLCKKFIRHGDRVFDILSRYEDITLYPVKAAKEGAARRMMDIVIPMLKVSGATDHSAYEFCRNDLRLMPGADKMLRYLHGLLPCYVNTSAFEHHMMSVSDSTGFPMSNINCSQVSFDTMEINREESKEIREMISRISSMRPSDLPDGLFEVGSYNIPEGWDTVKELDGMLLGRLSDMDFHDENFGATVDANEKSYALLEIRRQSNIDFNTTMYVGGSPSDHQALGMVKDGDGLAVSFNGSEKAVKNSNVAIMSSDSIVISVLTAEFYNEGMEAVFDLIDNWDREYIRTKEGPDRHLLDTLLERFPKKLPEVISVNRRNVDEVAERSAAYRRKFYSSDNHTKFQYPEEYM